MHSDSLRVVLCVNARGFSSFWLTLQTILASQHASTNLELFVFHDSLSPKKTNAVCQLVTERQATSIRFINVDPRAFFTGNPPFGLMSYVRLLIPTFIPSGRIVYMDTDVLVSRDIRHLMAYPMKTMLAAVPECSVGRSNCSRFLIARGVESDAPYFNAGVLVVDCSEWNARGVTRTLLDVGGQEHWLLPSGDQTLLNLYFRGRFDPLPERYNVLAWAAGRTGRHGPDTDTAVMTHFLGRPKPWEICGRVNVNYKTYERLLSRLKFRSAPVEAADVLEVTSRVARYLPAYWKCLRSRLAV